MGPTLIFYNQGHRYYIAFIDDYLLTSKGEALNTFKTFKKQVETRFDERIKIFQCDKGRELMIFEPYLKEEKIEMRYLCPCTHYQNRKVERKYRHLVEKD